MAANAATFASAKSTYGITATLVVSGDLVRSLANTCAENYLKFSLLINNRDYYTHFFLSQGDRQMMEDFVSGTKVFSNAKMTETQYE